MAAENNFKYEWNYNTLKRVYFQLKFKQRTEEEQKEYLLLEALLSDGSVLEGMTFVDGVDFSTAFKLETKTLLEDYYDYLSSIFEFYDNSDDTLTKVVYEKLDVTDEELLQTAHDFFKNLDPEWYQLFLNLYKQRKGTVRFSELRSFSSYFPSNGLWLANITRNNTIQDYVNTIHEFAHGIADQMVSDLRTYSPDNILLELFPIVCQMIFLYTYDENKLQNEITKYINNYLKIMIDYSEEIKMKFNIASTFVNVSNARNLSRLIKRKWNICIGKDELTEIYSNPVEELFAYVFPFLVAIELLEIYSEDKDKFKEIMNKMITSKLKPLDLLNELHIEPNKSLKLQ